MIQGSRPISIETQLSSFQLIDQNYCPLLDGTPATELKFCIMTLINILVQIRLPVHTIHSHFERHYLFKNFIKRL